MLHASVSYAAGMIFVAYDSQALDRRQSKRRSPAWVHAWSARPAYGETVGWAYYPRADGATGAAVEEEPTTTAAPRLSASVDAGALDAAAGRPGRALPGSSAVRRRTVSRPARWAALVFYVLAYIAGGYDIATHAIPALLRGKFDTDVLMLAAATGAAILGEWAEGAFLLFLFALGHAGEHYALDRARNAVNALGELMPKTARVRRGERIEEVAVETLQVDDVVMVRPGDRLPVDGVIVDGQSAINQAPVTGESVPVEKGPGDEVFAATINQDAALDVRVTRLTQDNTLSRVMQHGAGGAEPAKPHAAVHATFHPLVRAGRARLHGAGRHRAAARPAG